MGTIRGFSNHPKSLGRRASGVAPLVFTRRLLLPLTLAAVLGGCWSKSNSSLPEAGPLCNDLAYGSSFVQEMNSGNATLPDSTGGAITSGSYHLTASTYYPLASCTVDPIATTLLVAASSPTSGTMQTASLTSLGYILSESTTYVVKDTSLQIHIDCIVPDSGGFRGSGAQISYNATASEIQLYATGGCGNHVDIYDLDPDQDGGAGE